MTESDPAAPYESRWRCRRGSRVTSAAATLTVALACFTGLCAVRVAQAQAPAESAMPAWRTGMAVGEWRQIEGTALASAPMAVRTHPKLSFSGPKAKVIAWTGFALDTRDSALYSAASGGHMDYAGNEVNRLALQDDAPKWTEPRPATPVEQVVMNAAYYADGRPTSRHSYYGTWVDEVRGRVMLVGGSRWGDGSSPGTMDGYDIAKRDWDKAGTYAVPGKQFDPLIGSAIVADRRSGDAFAFSNWNINRWDGAGNRWEQVVANSRIYGQYAAAALDTKRARIFVLGGSGKAHGYLDLAAKKVVQVPISGPAAEALLRGRGNGMVYDPLLDAYLVHTGEAGGTVHRIDAQTFKLDTLPVTGGAGQPATANGVWRRFLYVPKLKGVVYVPTYDGNVWFLRTN